MYPNMSYVMFENTAIAMNQILTEMREAVEDGNVREFFQDLSKRERQAMSRLFDQCQEYCQLANDVWDEVNNEDDGQPSEAREWADFDADC